MILSFFGRADRLAGVNIARECPVDFRLVQGRVYHRGLVLEFPNVTVRIDGREVERLAGRAVQDAAQGVIHHELGRELHKGLDHLFGPLQGKP